MVVGSGLIAGAFEHYIDDEKILIFASGVSNSKCRDISAFERERELLKSALKKELTVIYFSTCSIYDSSLVESPYILHKLSMEELIRNSKNKYIIFRLPNVVGKCENPNTMMNYFFNSLSNESLISIHLHATRYLIHISDVKKIVSKVISDNINFNSTINLVYPKKFPITEIVETFEKCFNRKFKVKYQNMGSSYEVDISWLVNFGNSDQLIKEMLNLEQMIEYTYIWEKN